VATFLLPGIPLVYNGQELGSEVKANLFEKNSYDWNASPEVQAFYRKLLTLWASEPVFARGSMDVQDLGGAEGVAGYARDDGETRIIILANFRDQPQEVSLPARWRGPAHTDLWTGEAWEGGVLEPHGWRILKPTAMVSF
jgi:glycosidase